MISEEHYQELLKETFEIDFERCKSSNIFGYAFLNRENKETGTLYVAFKNQNIYAYFNVPNTTYEGLIKAESKGKFINANIVKEEFKFRKYAVQES